ncbi:MAG: FAD-dependent oxidoreductase [Candidatus Nealsonbacteria bacterium]|nr:FAD-dependent oxidoreductase [Candidatus Nealsonbacteria bacterium]
MANKKYDLIIIGGGPAAIAAGIYAARAKINTLIIAKTFGGQMTRKTVSIENYPGFKSISGADLVKKFVEHLQEYNVKIVSDSTGVIKKIGKTFSVKTAHEGWFDAMAVIVASGADPRPLEVPGEKEFIGRGVSYCTACDAPIFADKAVAVIGGGNSGFEAALALTKYAKKIYILEYAAEVKAEESNINLAQKSKKIKIMTSVEVKKILGDKFVSSVEYQNRRTGQAAALDVQGVFVEIGSIPATGFVKDLVDFNERDEIIIDSRTCATKTAGLFAAGDVTDVQYKQIGIAAGEGVKALFSVANYLRK